MFLKLFCVEHFVFCGMFHVEHFWRVTRAEVCQVILFEVHSFQSPPFGCNYGVLCIGCEPTFLDNRYVIFAYMEFQGKPIPVGEQRRMRDAAFAKLIEDMKPENQLKSAMVAARERAGLTQKELARRMGTKQPAIARLENGRSVPSITTLRRLAEVTGSRFILRLDGPVDTFL